MARFRDRRAAGDELGRHLRAVLPPAPTVVLGLPRGGVPVAAEVATALDAPLDVFVVRKLGVPGQRELAMGAIASGGVRVENAAVINALRICPDALDAVAAEEARELARREAAYRGDRAAVDLTDRRVVLVDDGLATGATMKAALAAVTRSGVGDVVVAVPTGAPSTCADLHAAGAPVVCLHQPVAFHAVGLSYDNFAETTDEEVRSLLQTIR